VERLTAAEVALIAVDASIETATTPEQHQELQARARELREAARALAVEARELRLAADALKDTSTRLRAVSD
jgi:F420-dependent methylenetetrahydromethanopterin dehydrogenase